MISLKNVLQWCLLAFQMRPPLWRRIVQSTTYIPTARLLYCTRFPLIAQCCCDDSGEQCANWHDLRISSLWREHSACLHVKMDAADISHCFSNPVKTLSQLISRHSKVTPTAQLDLVSIGDSVEMMNNRARILDASSHRMKPRRVLKHSSKESMPIHHCSPSLRTCNFFRHAIKKKQTRLQ